MEFMSKFPRYQKILFKSQLNREKSGDSPEGCCTKRFTRCWQYSWWKIRFHVLLKYPPYINDFSPHIGVKTERMFNIFCSKFQHDLSQFIHRWLVLCFHYQTNSRQTVITCHSTNHDIRWKRFILLNINLTVSWPEVVHLTKSICIFAW